MFITHQTPKLNYVDCARLALEGGVRLIQLRMKNASWNEAMAIIEKVKKECIKYNAKIIIDDYVDLAKINYLDGVHLGKKDMSLLDARRIFTNAIIIGATANSFNDIQTAVLNGTDYIGLGPLRFTKTKKKLSPVLGIEGYAAIIDRMNEERINIPVYAIGGVTPKDVKPLIKSGCYGVAVSSAIIASKNPQKVIEDFQTELYKCTI
jgi:thiamine-phosphate pyrophosphorylase